MQNTFVFRASQSIKSFFSQYNQKKNIVEASYPAYNRPKNYNFLLKHWLKNNPWVKVGSHVEFPLESRVLGTPTEIKDGVYINGPMVIKGSGKVSIGKYSVMAENFRIISSNHRIDRPDMQGKFTVPSDTSKGPVYIGNNVWCGDNVTILSGVSIGDGSVVGAGSIVTRDVPPFSVVAGVPAKIIKYRFSKMTIEKLLDISWWHFEHNTITNNKIFFSTIVVDNNIDTLEKKINLIHEKEIIFLDLKNKESSKWLLEGWGESENEGRWAEKNEASLIFKTQYPKKFNSLSFFSQSYHLPQEVKIFINRKHILNIRLQNKWLEYTVQAKNLRKGVNTVKLVFESSFSPIMIEKKSMDTRKLFCRFSWFKLI